MNPSTHISLLPPLLLLLLLLSLLSTSHAAITCYTSIFSFGDSLADTGNLLHDVGKNNIHVGRLPYGETYFRRPTGRFSDGRLVVDFLAQAMGLPLLPPYLAGPGRKGFRRGANFAVAGATAIENGFFTEKGIQVLWSNNSLGSQIEWFRQLLPSLCSSDSDCNDMFRNSLFLVGEIGGNDYNYPFLQARSLDEIVSYVPRVMDAISSAITALIELGARTLVVPGNFPIGCNSAYLTVFRSNRSEDYDAIGCIKWLNKFSRFHNNRLRVVLNRVRLRNPHATVIYADYYSAAMSLFSSPEPSGFRISPLPACCGGGGPYNYNSSLQCGNSGSNICADPSIYITWDGMHMTEAAYRKIAIGLLKGPNAVPAILNTCPQTNQEFSRPQYVLSDDVLDG
ncbi:GDSL esterase/lipase At1g31550-like [Phoenix dactylifera]|uniref:GDSL esterase/lipase At1g31550-like n=1 Tax=Phoenix dactylifera TaxID=42345 RepID=A0A8B7D346_PHODC|nr:GDSL esterase/lipase At1g31550-like [Phoenix dactylifera]